MTKDQKMAMRQFIALSRHEQLSFLANAANAYARGIKIETMPAACVAEGDSDAELIRLGGLFEAAWDEEAPVREDYDAEGDDSAVELLGEQWRDLNARTAALVHQIERIPARTLRGLVVKQRAVAWCCANDDASTTLESVFDKQPSYATDQRLIAGILDDLRMLSGALAPDPMPPPEPQPAEPMRW